jgi:hypothetical protein
MTDIARIAGSKVVGSADTTQKVDAGGQINSRPRWEVMAKAFSDSLIIGASGGFRT